MEGHCKEHEDRTICLAKLKADNETQKRQWDTGRAMMSQRADRMDAEIDRKLNISTFYKVVSILVGIAIIIFGVNFAMLNDIGKVVTGIDKKQAVILNEIEMDRD